MNSFENFFSDMGEKPKGLTLERKNVHLGYSPENCIWATYDVQARNRTDNLIVEHEGEKMILMDYAKLKDVSYKQLHHWIRYLNYDPAIAAAALKGKGSKFIPDYRKRHR